MAQPSGAPLFAWTASVRLWLRCEEFRAAQRDFPAIRSADCRTRAISRLFTGMFAALSVDIGGYTVPNISLARRFCLPALLWRLAALVFLLLMTAAAHTQSREPAIQAINAFENATHDYVLMHRRLEQQIGSIEFGTPVAEINRIIHELAAAIRAERANARQGDFFTPSLGYVLKARINDALLEHGSTANDVRTAGRVDGVHYERVRLQVNDTFPWILAVAMFPCVIEALPPLPPELQYRIVGDDLVLVDVHASLIVDILPYALVDMTARNSRPQGNVR